MATRHGPGGRSAGDKRPGGAPARADQTGRAGRADRADRDDAHRGNPLVFREHWRVLVRPVVMLFAVVAVAAFLASIAPGGGFNWVRIAIVLVAAGAVGHWTVLPWLRWLTDQHVVEDGRLVVRAGLWTQEGRALALAYVVDITVTQDSFVERMLGIGTLAVRPEGDREPIELVGVPRAAEARAALLALVEAARADRSPAGPQERRDSTG